MKYDQTSEQQVTLEPAMLQMWGSPPSRLRTEHLSSRMDKVIAGIPGLTGIRFPIPNKEIDIHAHIQKLIRNVGFSNLDEAIAGMNLPGNRLMAIQKNCGAVKPKKLTARQQLRNAIILGKTGCLLYDPSLPPVFTRRRLERELDYITFKINDFYELD